MKKNILELFSEWATCQNFFGEYRLIKDPENKAIRIDIDTPEYLAYILFWIYGDYYAEIVDIESGRYIYSKRGIWDNERISLDYSEIMKIEVGGNVYCKKIFWDSEKFSLEFSDVLKILENGKSNLGKNHENFDS